MCIAVGGWVGGWGVVAQLAGVWWPAVICWPVSALTGCSEFIAASSLEKRRAEQRTRRRRQHHRCRSGASVARRPEARGTLDVASQACRAR